MADNTILNPGAGGDVIMTEQPGGAGPKIPVSKIRLGVQDTDGGDVSSSNPFPVLQILPALAVWRSNDGQPPGVVLKNAPGVLWGFLLGNVNATLNAFMKFYDKATTPVSTDTPKFIVQAGPTLPNGGNFFPGIPFTNGISLRITSGWQDNDTTGAGVGSFQPTVFYS